MAQLLQRLQQFLPTLDTQPALNTLPLMPATLAQRLKDIYAPRWSALNRSSSFNTLELLGRDIEAEAKNYAYSPLQIWGQRLSVQAAGFDVDHVFATLAEFSMFINQ
jgi:hypothetical protein